MSNLAAMLVLAAMLAASWIARHRLLHADPGAGRNRAFARVALRQIIGFAAPALASLSICGALPAIRTPPAGFGALAEAIGIAGWLDGDDVGPLAIGAVAGSALGTAFEHWRWRRTGRRGPVFGEIGWLLARNRRDLGWGIALSVIAGVAEELYFRLALPLLLMMVTGSAALSFGIAIMAFGAAHRYQGWAGMIATALIGALFLLLYLASGALWLAIAAHIVIDLNSLVLRPAVTGAWKRA